MNPDIIAKFCIVSFQLTLSSGESRSWGRMKRPDILTVTILKFWQVEEEWGPHIQQEEYSLLTDP